MRGHPPIVAVRRGTARLHLAVPAGGGDWEAACGRWIHGPSVVEYPDGRQCRRRRCSHRLHADGAWIRHRRCPECDQVAAAARTEAQLRRIAGW